MRRKLLVDKLLRRVDALPWDRDCAAYSCQLRALMGESGNSLAPYG